MLDHTLWLGKDKWKIAPGPAASDLGENDRLTFHSPKANRIDISSVVCSHGSPHDGGNWKGPCFAIGNVAIGFTKSAQPFVIISLDDHKLACYLILTTFIGSPGVGGGACWTATDG